MGAFKARLAVGVFALVLCVGFGIPETGAQEGESAGFMAASGRVTFRTYCASCHGADAKGTGRVARYLTVTPPNLTLLETNPEGLFPKERVYQVIDGRQEVGAHGVAEMPVWGDVFQSSLANETRPLAESGDERADRKIRELVYFLESIQSAKAATPDDEQ